MGRRYGVGGLVPPLALVLALVAGCGSGSDPVETSGRLAFVSERGSSSVIYVVNSDGSGRRQLTRPRSPHDGVGGVVWSPDGGMLAYSASLAGWNDDAYSDLFVVKADGSGVRRLTRTYADDWGPSWSPDGETIAFDRNDDGLNWVYVLDATGGGVRRLTPNYRWYPAWSPDGRLAFVDSSGGVWVMNRDGSQKRRIARMAPFNPSAAAWSPDGRSIAFTSDTALWVMRSDGSGRRKLFGDADRHTAGPSWSPDGRTIAFTQGDGDFEIFIVKADGTGLRNLTDNRRVQDLNPVWSPDGRAIAYTTDRDGDSEIYVMNADGSGQRNLTDNLAEDCCQAWTPSH
jgi:Tol biopolymer transport system component